MVFTSPFFIFVYLVACIGVYYGFLRKIESRNIWLFMVSLFFYAYGEKLYVVLLLASIFMNWKFGLLVDKHREDEKAKGILTLMLICNLGLLGIFKYTNFIVSNIENLLNIEITDVVVHLPIGISFFTFQAISYVIDIYRKHGEVQQSVLGVGLYISFFPQLVAGPIVRYETVAHQILHRKETVAGFAHGINRFIIGLFKKVLIANQMALVADAAFDGNAGSVAMAWLGMIAYTLQIYYDFSGYSDMAIGLGAMFGFKFNENFKYPYISHTITEFWRRWHISLGSWFRDYVYIPLGGSRNSSKSRLYFNLFVVWFLTGLWHGASWNFIAWGLYYLCFLVVEKTLLSRETINGYSMNIFKKILLHGYSLIVVMFGWVLFRALTLTDAIEYYQILLGMNEAMPATDMKFFITLGEKWMHLVAGIIFCLPIYPKIDGLVKKYGEGQLNVKSAVFAVLYSAMILAMLSISIAYIIKGTYDPFIYFNF